MESAISSRTSFSGKCYKLGTTVAHYFWFVIVYRSLQRVEIGNTDLKKKYIVSTH